MQVQERTPYAGALVFTAFSGSLHAVSSCQHPKFRVANSGSPVIVGMYGKHDRIAIFHMFVHVLNLPGKNMRHRHLHRGRQVDTFEAVKGAPHVIVHLYNSTSKIQREQVFKKDREEIKKLAVDGARLLSELAAQDGGDIRFEYSPESFSQTEVEYASEVCNAVLDVWQPTVGHKAIINLPSTVQVAMPHIFAGQIEYMHKHCG